MTIFPSLPFSFVRLLWSMLTSRCCARQSIQILKRWHGHHNANELSSSMLAPCDLLAEKGDSFSPRKLSQRWLGLMTTLGEVKPPVSQIKQVMLIIKAITEWTQDAERSRFAVQESKSIIIRLSQVARMRSSILLYNIWSETTWARLWCLVGCLCTCRVDGMKKKKKLTKISYFWICQHKVPKKEACQFIYYGTSCMCVCERKRDAESNRGYEIREKCRDGRSFLCPNSKDEKIGEGKNCSGKQFVCSKGGGGKGQDKNSFWILILRQIFIFKKIL